jgi:DNA-binding GntR family transcriptional regulator
LTELAVTRVREAIVEGDLALGERISEASVATSLGISKTPVRAALARLQSERLVTILPRRGTFVFTVDGEEVRAISELRLTLEASALSLALARNRCALITGLSDAVDRMTEAYEQGDVRGYLRLDSTVHEQFFQHCDNSYLADAYRPILAKLAAMRTHLSVRPLQIEESHDEHHEILDGVVAGCLDRAVSVLDRQIARMVRSFEDDDTAVARQARRGAARLARGGLTGWSPAPDMSRMN